MLQLHNLTLRRHSKVLLDKASVTINPQERVGLIGRNGAGKSSLFALLAGDLSEDSGSLSLPSSWRLSQVAQNLPQTNANISDFVLAGDNNLIQLQQQLVQAETENDGLKIAHLHTALIDAGVNDAKARAQALILGLGFKASQLNARINEFSGGWQMRLQLARALMAPSDLLLLDEPTNHLDLDALIWLESWLRQYRGTLIVISHDREFLDTITNFTLHIEQQKLTKYSGNYSSFETLHQQQLELQQQAYGKQQDKIAHLQKFIDRFKAKASKAKQAQSRVKALEKMQLIAPIMQQADFSFNFAEPKHLPNPMLKLDNLSCGYQADTPIVSAINRLIAPAQRIGLLGANGQGKSTLVKSIVHQLKPLVGEISYGKGLRIGYFAQQELDVLHADQNALQHIIQLAKQQGSQVTRGSREQDLRNYLGQFNFSGDMATQLVGSMSGGEKARLLLALMVWQQPNLLILDEPTNHLDLITRQALAYALNSFDGSLLLVSHDRALLRSVCDEFWLVADAKVADFNGDLTDYQRYILQQAKQLKEELKPTSTIPTVDNPLSLREQRKQQTQRRLQLQQQLKPLQQQLKQLEQQISQLEQHKNQLTENFNAQLSPAQLLRTSQDFQLVEQRLTAAEQQWLEIAGTIEQLGTTAPDN